MALGESGEPIVNVQRFDAEIRNSVQFLYISALCLFISFFFFFYQSRSNLMQKINSVMLLIYMYVAFPFIRFKYSMQQNQKQIIAEKIENEFSEISRFEI